MQELWGPIVNYDFDDLRVGCPLKGTRLPYCLYLYPSRLPTMVAFQFVGDEIVEKRCSYAQYHDYQKVKRSLTYQGWHVIEVIREFLNEDIDQFELYISKAIEMAAPRIQ